jgi:hypothetical protein
MYGDVEIAKLRQEIADLRALVETRPVPPHARQHEITGEDTVRPTVYNNGTLLARHRALNFSTGLTATVDNANKRINVAAAGVTDHGELDGLTDDDHAQYLDETRHDALDHTGLTGVPTQYTDEMAQDAVGAMVTGNTETGIAVTYDDAAGKLNFDASHNHDASYVPLARTLSNGYGVSGGGDLSADRTLAVGLTNQTAACNSNLTCTTSYQDVSNATLTLAAVGTYLVLGFANISVDCTAATGDNGANVQLLVGASAQTATITCYASDGERYIGTVGQAWLVTTTGTDTVIKFQGKKSQNRSTVTVYATDTTITAIRLA